MAQAKASQVVQAAHTGPCSAARFSARGMRNGRSPSERAASAIFFEAPLSTAGGWGYGALRGGSVGSKPVSPATPSPPPARGENGPRAPQSPGPAAPEPALISGAASKSRSRKRKLAPP